MAYNATHATLFIRERIVDHDGYCSGDENYPSVKCYTVTLPLPDGIVTPKLGDTLSRDVIDLIPVTSYSARSLNIMGSRYCKPCYLWSDISRHDCAMDVIAAIAV